MKELEKSGRCQARSIDTSTGAPDPPPGSPVLTPGQPRWPVQSGLDPIRSILTDTPGQLWSPPGPTSGQTDQAVRPTKNRTTPTYVCKGPCVLYLILPTYPFALGL
jgi:hypothetical protein